MSLVVAWTSSSFVGRAEALQSLVHDCLSTPSNVTPLPTPQPCEAKEEDVCPICLGHLQDEPCTLVQCRHTFCLACVLRWFRLSSFQCPLCKAEGSWLLSSSSSPSGESIFKLACVGYDREAMAEMPWPTKAMLGRAKEKQAKVHRLIQHHAREAGKGISPPPAPPTATTIESPGNGEGQIDGSKKRLSRKASTRESSGRKRQNQGQGQEPHTTQDTEQACSSSTDTSTEGGHGSVVPCDLVNFLEEELRSVNQEIAWIRDRLQDQDQQDTH